MIWSALPGLESFSLAMAGRLLFGLEWEAGLTNVLAGSGANVLMGSFRSSDCPYRTQAAGESTFVWGSARRLIAI